MMLAVAGARDDDAALLRASAGGDRAAFARLYEEHRRRVHRVAYGILLDEDEARDAVQEAFARLHDVAPRWEPNARVATWLHRVVVNHCLGLRRRMVGAARALVARPERSAEATPERRASAGEAVGIVERSLASMTLRARAIATLHLEAELEPREIATLVGLTPNATRVALHRALEKLREDLRAAGIDAAPDDETAPNEEEDHADAS